VTFVESRGDDAASQLDALATHLAAHGWPARGKGGTLSWAI
jgi:hypothetical protein